MYRNQMYHTVMPTPTALPYPTSLPHLTACNPGALKPLLHPTTWCAQQPAAATPHSTTCTPAAPALPHPAPLHSTTSCSQPIRGISVATQTVLTQSTSTGVQTGLAPAPPMLRVAPMRQLRAWNFIPKPRFSQHRW